MINNTQDAVLDIQCPICLEQYDDGIHYPIIVCSNQHKTCQRCHEQLFKGPSRCPICKIAIRKQQGIRFRTYFTIKDFFQKNNTYKTVIGIDGTSSMKQVIASMSHILRHSFDKITAFIKQNNIICTFLIKIIVYRNYNSQFRSIIEETNFEKSPQKLQLFLQGVKAKQGWQNEAIELLFQKINAIDKVNQVILIGDAASNDSQETEEKRLMKGQKYWNNYSYPKTSINNELNQFKKFKCPIHSFFLDDQYFFQQLSSSTQGKSQKCQTGNLNFAELLTQFITSRSLQMIKKGLH